MTLQFQPFQPPHIYRQQEQTDKRRICVIGGPGTGKTFLSGTAGGVYFFSTDHGLQGIPAGVEAIVHNYTIDDAHDKKPLFLPLLHQLKQIEKNPVMKAMDRNTGQEKEFKIETVCIDTLTLLGHCLLIEAGYDPNVTGKTKESDKKAIDVFDVPHRYIIGEV